jgi:flagellin-like protein
MVLKQVRYRKDRAVSELIGTLLLIAITVILMTTLGLFLFQNAPKGNPEVPKMEILLTRDDTSYNNEYLMIVQSVTEKIPVDQIDIEYVVNKLNNPVIISLNGDSTYSSYPVIMKMSYTFESEKNYVISQFNSSVQIEIYLTPNMNLSYVSVIDMSTDSVIAGSPVTGTSVAGSTNTLEPFVAEEINTNDLTYNDLNTSNPTGIAYNNETIFFPHNKVNDTFEFNSSKFTTNIPKYQIFWNYNSSFPYTQLNSSTVKSYGMYATSSFHISNKSQIKFNFVISEPTYVKVYQVGNQSNTIVPLDKTVYNYNYSGGIQNIREKFTLVSGYYIVQIYYLYKYSNGILAVEF